MNIRIVEKSKSKKWSSADAKQRARELDASWNQLKAKYETQPKKTLQSARISNKGLGHLVSFTPPRGNNTVIPSKDSGIGIATKSEQKVYTGENVLGISLVHKSCLQPVFSKEQAEDFANMRR